MDLFNILDSMSSLISEEQTSKGASPVTGLKTDGTTVIGGKTILQWDQEWQNIGRLKDACLTPYNHCVGLYRHVINGRTRYIGRAIELNNGGFRKRLSDYRRSSSSARTHSSGQLIYEHLDEIETYILVVGRTREAVETTEKLETAFIDYYKNREDLWNIQGN